MAFLPEYASNALINTDYFNGMSGQSIVSGSPEEFNLIINVNAASDIFEKILGRPILARDYSYISTDIDINGSSIYDPDRTIFDGPKGILFWFPVYPVNTIYTFMINGDVIPVAPPYTEDTDTYEEDGYFIYPKWGKLTYIDGFCHSLKQNLITKYNAGYISNSNEYQTIQYLCYLATVKFQSFSPEVADLESEKLMDYTYKKIDAKQLDKYQSLIPDVWRALQTYKRTVFA